MSPETAPFAFEPLLSLNDKRFHGLQLVYTEQPDKDLRPPSIEFLAELVSRWSDRSPPVRLTVPCDVPDVAASGFAGTWIAAARKASIEPSLLELGITPRHPLSNTGDLSTNLAMLREAGVGVCQLDFGAGHASLATWPLLPLTRVEVPPAFIDTQAEATAPILTSVFRMVDALGIVSSASGVETQRQMDLLQELGCMLVRGPAIAHRLTVAQAAPWLRENASQILPDPS